MITKDYFTQPQQNYFLPNKFEFDGKVYQQLQGTAMGAARAPSYANLFMGRLEQTILAHSDLNPLYNNNTLMTY